MTEPLDLFETDAPDLETLRERAATCTACELHHDATGTVFGSGPRRRAW